MDTKVKDTLISLEEVQFAIDVAAGRKEASILLKNAKLINVFSQTIEESHVVVAGRLFAGVGSSYANAKAKQVIDLAGAYLAPGLIDGHLHIESSLVTPAAYASAVLPRGVTGVVCDPHEIANVSGVQGITWLLESSQNLPLDVWVTVPSCVPATQLETSGAHLGLAEIESLMSEARVVGVAEIMSFPLVIAADSENLSKALLAERYGKSPEGHAPAVTGKDLQAYYASGIASDHESTTLAEGFEKLRSGVFLMIREGSVTRNLDALMPLIRPEHSDRIGFVTDDRLPHDLLAEGGVDCLVRRCIQAGINPALAVKCGSYSTAKHYKLNRLGAIAAGYIADFAIIDDLENYHVTQVYKQGQKVVHDAALCEPIYAQVADARAVSHTVSLRKELTPQDLALKLTSPQVRVIEPIAYQVLTLESHKEVNLVNGCFVADATQDLAKLLCFERHGKNGNIGLAIVSDFGLKSGALASTVGHDHHNLMAVGMNDDDIIVAARRLEALGGGFICVNNGEVLAELALPIAGLVTDEALEHVKEKIDALEHAAKSLGASIPSPYMTLSFLGLEVIPKLRLTDIGLIDVDTMAKVSVALKDL